MSTEEAASAGFALVVSSAFSAASSDWTRPGYTMPFNQGARHCTCAELVVMTNDKDWTLNLWVRVIWFRRERARLCTALHRIIQSNIRSRVAGAVTMHAYTSFPKHPLMSRAVAS